MRTIIFGTYDTAMHPRIATIAEGLAAADSTLLNATYRLGLLLRIVLTCLLSRGRSAGLSPGSPAAGSGSRHGRRLGRPDAVVVGYLGHFDVHLARLRTRAAACRSCLTT